MEGVKYMCVCVRMMMLSPFGAIPATMSLLDSVTSVPSCVLVSTAL